ncbi:MAG: hypothetical protein GXP13_02825 [Gammaproteobacteria bacterium]|nr:hypothetical protein [Gammaproteobacteria bacterium]
MAASIDKRKYTINDFSIIYYMLEKADETLARKIPPLAGRTINQMNINAHYVNNGYWADLHISKMLSKPTDEATFKKFVSSIIISDE